MTVIKNKLRLVHLYIAEAFRLKCVNGMVDDYDICRSIGDNFEPIANLKLPILSILECIVSEYDPKSIIVNEDCVDLLDENGVSFLKFSFIITPILSFSGNIGIREIEYDGGLTKHISYLSLFFPLKESSLMGIESTHGNCNEDFIYQYYIDFYSKVSLLLQNDPMSLYSLLTGIKKHYNLLDTCVLLETDGYSFIDFTKLKCIDFINNFSEVEIESSDTSPMLKISYQGNKLLHLRTKIEKKNSSYKLRFFIETSSKFLKLFKKDN